MARRTRELINARMDAVADALVGLDRRAEKMEVVLMVREPGSASAAEAYDGLRRQVVAAVNERFTQLTQLVQFDAALRNGAGVDVLRKMVDGWCETAGLVLVSDPSHPQADELYDIVEDRGGQRLEVVDPAYVDQQSGRVIRRGQAVRTAIEAGTDDGTSAQVAPTEMAVTSNEAGDPA